MQPLFEFRNIFIHENCLSPLLTNKMRDNI